MFKHPIAAFLAALLFVSPAHSSEQVAIVRAEGLLVFVPEIGGPDTYGTYLVPNALGRDSTNRFLYLGNPLQINFLAPSELPAGFADMGNSEKLDAFFETESRHLSKAFNQEVKFTNVESAKIDGVEHRSGTVSFLDASGTRREIRITARPAGVGILHAGYQPENPETVPQARKMVDGLLASYELVRRPLNTDELAKRSSQSKE